MRSATRWGRATCTLMLLLAMGACHRDPQIPLIIVAHDLTGSAFERNGELAPRAVEQALKEVSEKDGKLVVIAITDDTAGKQDIPVSGSEGDFSVKPAQAKTDVLRLRWKAQQRVAVKQRYEKWRSKATPVVGSDYLGLLLVLDDVIAGSSEGPKEVWIVGDGFQSTKEWQLKPASDNRATCRSKVQQLRGAGKLGQLHGAAVLFRGGGMRDDSGSSSEQIVLKECWDEIIRGAGGATPPGWWGGRIG
jgi:hypothetical protein